MKVLEVREQGKELEESVLPPALVIEYAGPLRAVPFLEVIVGEAYMIADGLMEVVVLWLRKDLRIICRRGGRGNSSSIDRPSPSRRTIQAIRLPPPLRGKGDARNRIWPRRTASGAHP